MDKDVFLGWLSGILELVKAEKLSLEESQAIIVSIQDHLKLVVKKVTPDRTVAVAGFPVIEKPAPDNKIAPSIPWPKIDPWEPGSKRDNYWLDRYFGPNYAPSYEPKFAPGTLIC